MNIFFKIGILSTALILSGCIETERGEKVGIINKISKEGLIFTTNEATLMRGGLNDGSGSWGQAFKFSIESNDLANKLEQAINSGAQVKIKYHKEFIVAWWRGKENYLLDDFTFIKEKI